MLFSSTKIENKMQNVSKPPHGGLGADEDYYPFGMIEPGRQYEILGDSAYRFGFNGKEHDDNIYGKDNSYDYGMRFYDPRLGKFMSVDPIALKYTGISPYVYVADMPITATDHDGKDIIVLNNPNGASGYGHTAVLIGNDKDRWIFISKEGRDKGHNEPFYSNEVTGGPSRTLIKPFNSLDAFKAAQKQASQENLDKEKEGGELDRYTQSIRFKTDSKQDKLAKDASKKAANCWYQFYGSNCADAVSDALFAAGLDPGFSGSENYNNGFSNATGEPAKRLDPRPNIRFQKIKENNPGKTGSSDDKTPQSKPSPNEIENKKDESK